MDYVLGLNASVKLSTTVTSLSSNILSHFINRGLTEIALSLNASTAIEHNKIRGINRDFEKTIEIINKFRNSDIQIILTYVITRENINHLYELFTIVRPSSNIIIKLQLIESSLLPYKSDRQANLLEKSLIYSLYTKIFPFLTNQYRKDKIFIAPLMKIEKDSISNQQIENYSKGIYNLKDGEIFCEYMLHNPHIKEDCLVYPCCGKEKTRIIGDLRKQSILEIYSQHINRFRNRKGLPFYSCKYCIFYTFYLGPYGNL